MGLDDRVVLRKPQPSYLISQGPREWSLVGLIPFLNPPREGVGGGIGLDGFVVINLPSTLELHVVGHVLANRGEVDTDGDAQTRKLGLVANSREHEELWCVEYTRAQNHFLAGGYLPPLTLCPVNEKTREVGLIDSLEGPVPNSTPLNLGVVVPGLPASRSFVAWA